jgi:hypothetical protein
MDLMFLKKYVGRKKYDGINFINLEHVILVRKDVLFGDTFIHNTCN